MTSFSDTVVDWRQFEDDGGFAEVTIEWLSLRGPDTWHRSACGINWDWGWRLLGWIVSQRGCSRSTAAMIFWMAQPQELVDPKLNASHREDPASPYYLIKLIAENLRAGIYSSQDFAVYWDGDFDRRVSRFAELLDRDPALAQYWSVFRTFVPLVRVSKFDHDAEFVEGIPVEIWNEAEELL
jgi:hypothetical protein